MVCDKSAAVKQEAHAFAEGYKKFLDAGKTEREVAAESERMLKDAGYQQFDPKMCIRDRPGGGRRRSGQTHLPLSACAG